MLEQESKNSRHKHSANREHQESFDLLGLSEQEALEYAIMLSREENNHNVGMGESSASHIDSISGDTSESFSPQDPAAEEGVFGWDTDEAYSDKSSQRLGSDVIPVSASSSNSSSNGNDDVRSSNSSPRPSINTNDQLHFPPISPTPVNTPGLGSGSSSRLNVMNVRSSAWGTPLKGSSTSPPNARSNTSVASSSSTEQRRTVPVSSPPGSSGDDLDNDLRLAIELSLAEARSRGDQV